MADEGIKVIKFVSIKKKKKDYSISKTYRS